MDTAPPPYKDIITEITDYSALTIDIDNNLDSLTRSTQKLQASESTSVQVEARRIQTTYASYLWDDVRQGSTVLAAAVKDFVDVMLPMFNESTHVITRDEKLQEIDGFLSKPVPKPATSEARLAEIKALGPATRELSYQLTDLVKIFVDMKNANIKAFNADLVKEKAKLTDLKEQLSKPSKGSDRFGSDFRQNPKGDEKAELEKSIEESEAKIAQIKQDIDAANAITAEYSPIPSEFNKIADKVSAAFNVVPEQLRTTVLKIYARMKQDAAYFRNGVEAGVDTSKEASEVAQQYSRVQNALDYLATNVRTA